MEPIVTTRDHHVCRNVYCCHHCCFDCDWFRSVGDLPHECACSSTGQGIDPQLMMMNASAMPATEFVDYSFVH